MAGFIERGMPRDWEMAQMITMADATTFEVYMGNMRQMMAEQINFTELVIFNRCNKDTKRNTFRKLVRTLNRRAQVVFESQDGNDGYDDEIELPYDINADFIKVEPENFGIFYVDIMDRPERYDGKTVEYTGELLIPEELGGEAFVPGRMVMTCCEADMRFLGLICKYSEASKYHNRDWVTVRGKVHAEENEEYGGIGPVIYCDSVCKAEKIDEIAGF